MCEVHALIALAACAAVLGFAIGEADRQDARPRRPPTLLARGRGDRMTGVACPIRVIIRVG
jgi:hypothetical protein